MEEERATHENHYEHVGALLMSLSTVIVAINAQLLRRVELSA